MMNLLSLYKKTIRVGVALAALLCINAIIGTTQAKVCFLPSGDCGSVPIATSVTKICPLGTQSADCGAGYSQSSDVDGCHRCTVINCPRGETLKSCANGYTPVDTANYSGKKRCHECKPAACPSGSAVNKTCGSGWTANNVMIEGTSTFAKSGDGICQKCVADSCKIGGTDVSCNNECQEKVSTGHKSGDSTCYECKTKAGYTFANGTCEKTESCRVGYTNIGKTSQSCKFNYDSDQYALSNGDNCFKRCYCPDKAYENNPEDDTLTISIEQDYSSARNEYRWRFSDHWFKWNYIAFSSPVLKFNGGKKLNVSGKVKFRTAWDQYIEKDFSCNMANGTICQVPFGEEKIIAYQTYNSELYNTTIVKNLEITLQHSDMPDYKTVLKYNGGYYDDFCETLEGAKYVRKGGNIYWDGFTYGSLAKLVGNAYERSTTLTHYTSGNYDDIICFNYGADNDLKWHATTYFKNKIISDFDVSWYKRKSNKTLGTYSNFYYGIINHIVEDGVFYDRDNKAPIPYMKLDENTFSKYSDSYYRQEIVMHGINIHIPLGFCGGKDVILKTSPLNESFPLKDEIMNDMEETDENCEFPGQGVGSTSSGGDGSFGGGSGSGSSKCWLI